MFHYACLVEKIYVRGLYTELLYANIHTLFSYFLPFCHPYGLLGCWAWKCSQG